MNQTIHQNASEIHRIHEISKSVPGQHSGCDIDTFCHLLSIGSSQKIRFTHVCCVFYQASAGLDMDIDFAELEAAS